MGMAQSNAQKLGPKEMMTYCSKFGSIVSNVANAENLIKSCGYHFRMGFDNLNKYCSEHHGNEYVHKGVGGIRIPNPDASIELGGDIKLSRAGFQNLLVHNFLEIKGALNTNIVLIDGVDFKTLVKKWTQEVLSERGLWKKLD